MKRSFLLVLALLVVALLAAAVLALPKMHTVYTVISWKIEGARTYLRNLADPAGQMPTPLPQPRISHKPLPTPSIATAVCPGDDCSPSHVKSSSTPLPSHTPSPTPTQPPLPERASLAAPRYEKQDPNNCGPATLTMALRFYGWEGTQFDIADVIKPDKNDRNVNVDELVYFVRTRAGWLDAGYRVGGTLEILKRFIANGLPIMIEEASFMSESYWPGDDHWAGHYLLLTGFDDASQTFTSQDSWLGANLPVAYDKLNQNWQSFNRVFIYLYRPEELDTVKSILGSNWDEAANRQAALEAADAETKLAPSNAFAWFNLGTNLLYFDRYSEAATAYDMARQVGLPQRMLRYQFGPFITYFKLNRNDDLLALSQYALKISPNSEENLLWHGWALYRLGKKSEAIDEFQKALVYNPGYLEAQYAIDFVQKN